MINIRSDGEITKIRSACEIAAEAMEIERDEINP